MSLLGSCHSALLQTQKAKRFVQLRDIIWQDIAAIALDAAREITRLSAQKKMVQQKADLSPVTRADKAAHQLIVKALMQRYPAYAVISEEAKTQPALTPYWFCVDPLDGTRSYIRGTGEYTVNIALIRGDMPVMGVIACPLDEACYAAVVGEGIWRKREEEDWQPLNPVHSNKKKRAILSSATLSARMQEWLDAHGVRELNHMSSARKFCVLAEGGAQLYPRFGTTMEWDTAAGHALLREVGGDIVTMEGEPLRYGKPNFTNGGFVAYSQLTL